VVVMGPLFRLRPVRSIQTVEHTVLIAEVAWLLRKSSVGEVRMPAPPLSEVHLVWLYL
jgi:predicted thioredoxin/glutaredoxin